MRIIKSLSLTMSLLSLGVIVNAQPSVSNVSFVQQPAVGSGTEVLVSYDVTNTTQPLTVSLLLSQDGGTTFNLEANDVSGDVGTGVSAGTGKTITWNIASDLPNAFTTNAAVRVIAQEGTPVPLTITGSPIGNGDQSLEDTTTLTFTFDQPVIGFDQSDLFISNASVNSFTPISGSIYEVDITANNNGKVAIYVAPEIATAGGVGNASSAFSFDYQLVELLPVAAGSFMMGNADVGDDLMGFDFEFPRHTVNLSAYEIGKFEVTVEQYAEVMNWALAQGYLANDNTGTPYVGGSEVYFAKQDGTQAYQLLFDAAGIADIIWNGSAFEPRIRDSFSMAKHPIHSVTWYGCAVFCNFLSEMEGKDLAYNTVTWTLADADLNTSGFQFPKGYRLPTEAEWERAAAWEGPKRYVYSFSSDTLTGGANVNYILPGTVYVNPLGLSAFPYTSPVGWFDGVNISPNGNVATIDSISPVGAYDMSGNLWERVHDWLDFDYYQVSPGTDPLGSEPSGDRVTRGGSWQTIDLSNRSSRRGGNPPEFRNDILGFRIARSQ